MVKFSMRLAALFCLLLAFPLAPKIALAEGFALYEWGARGMALGGAMMARAPDASAVASNAALLTRLPGRQAMLGITAVRPTGRFDKVDPGAGNEMRTTNLKDNIWPVPHAYYTHQINDDWFFGIGAFTRFGLGLNYPSNWPGRFNVRDVELTTASVNSTAAWKATDKLSLAAGVELMYVTLDLKKRVGAPGVEADVSITDAQGWGFGANLAMHYEFNDQWAVGLQYRSQVSVRATGDTKVTNINMPEPVYTSLAPKSGTARSTVILPDSIAAGVAWTPTPDLSIEAGAIWTRWSTFRSLDIEMPKSFGTAKNPKHWNDVWRFNLGVEYQALDWMTLRAGYVWDQSPVPNRYQDYLVPTGDRHMGSLGAGFQWGDAWTLDIAYAYIKPQNRFYVDRPDTRTVKGNTRNMYTQLLSLSLGYRF